MNSSEMPSPYRFVVDVPAELDGDVVQSRWEHVAVLLRMSTMSGMQMNLTATLKVICDHARKIISFDAALVYYWQEQEERALLRVSENVESGTKEALLYGNILDFWIRQFGQPIKLGSGDHPKADEVLSALGASSVLALPVLVNSRMMGSMQLFARQPNAFGFEDAQLLWMLMRISENLMTREHAMDSLMNFAFTDHLTGLKTRGYFEQQLELEIKRSERKREKFVLLMLDIDHFKCLNDTYGHHIGDRVLRNVAAVLTQDMREVDTVARYGGEEFVIILPETTEEEGYVVAQRIRKAVEEEDFFDDTVPIRRPMTISIGMAVFDSDSVEKRELVRFADVALYWSKGQGRNRVVRYSELAEQQRKEVS